MDESLLKELCTNLNVRGGSLPALEILKECEEKGLVHISSNTSKYLEFEIYLEFDAWNLGFQRFRERLTLR